MHTTRPARLPVAQRATAHPVPPARPSSDRGSAARATAPPVVGPRGGERDVWVDAVRAASLAVVVLGHWLLAVVDRTSEGLSVDTILVAAPWTHWLTLGLQVMGAFFLVGGAVSVASWRRARAAAVAADRSPADAYAGWLGQRLAGLVVPTLPVLGLWAVLTPVLARTGLSPDLAATAGRSALAPLWFLGVYLVIQALVPLIDRAVRRAGWRRVCGLLLAGSAAVDLGARALDLPLVGVVGFLTVWSIPVVLGVALADGDLGAAVGRRLAAAGAASVALLVVVFGYPVLMVGTLPDGGSNQNPPSLALAALVLCHVGLLLMTRERLTRALSGPRGRRLTAVAGTWSMPVFLWHMSAMALAIAASWHVPALVLGLVEVDPLSMGWWLVRPLWWAVVAVWTIPLLVISVVVGRSVRATGAEVGLGRVLLSVAAAVPALAIGTAQVDRPVMAVTALLVLTATAAVLGTRPSSPVR